MTTEPNRFLSHLSMPFIQPTGDEVDLVLRSPEGIEIAMFRMKVGIEQVVIRAMPSERAVSVHMEWIEHP